MSEVHLLAEPPNRCPETDVMKPLGTQQVSVMMKPLQAVLMKYLSRRAADQAVRRSELGSAAHSLFPSGTPRVSFICDYIVELHDKSNKQIKYG